MIVIIIKMMVHIPVLGKVVVDIIETGEVDEGVEEDMVDEGAGVDEQGI